MLRGLSSHTHIDCCVWGEVLKVYGGGGHEVHEDLTDGARHGHAQHYRGTIKKNRSRMSKRYWCWQCHVVPWCDISVFRQYIARQYIASIKNGQGQNQKVYISNVDSLWLRGGSEFFRFFPNSNNWNMTFLACLLPSLNACCLPACLLPSLILMIYETAIGEIYATFGT